MELGESPPRSLWLTRERFSCIATDDCHFPAEDAGFKGSAWHGRIDNAMRRNPNLAATFHQSNGRSAYWLETPEDRSDATAGPFSTTPYPAHAHAFTVSVWVAGEATLDDEVVQRIREAVALAGRAQYPYSAEAGFVGRYRVVDVHRDQVTLHDLHQAWQFASKVSTQSALLDIEFVTMVRLGDGPFMNEAFAALARGEQMVPRLEVLIERIIGRLTKLPLGITDEWHPWLQSLKSSVISARDEFRPTNASVYPYDAARLSGWAHQKHPIGGLLGRVQYLVPTATLPAIAVLLTLAEHCAIGRKTGLGLGRVRFSHAPCH